jgi:hypothetical protein
MADSSHLLDLSAAFERTLDPTQRARFGAYYTARDDILLLVEPVLMQPLREAWKAVVGAVRERPLHELHDLRAGILHRLRTTTVLDPACGTGNFLVVALEALIDLEREIIEHPLWQGLPEEIPQVHPRQMFGIEKDPAACAVARAALQTICVRATWQVAPTVIDNNIVCMDALVGVAADGTTYHPDWPTVDMILSNPPFLGSRKLRPELGRAYVDQLKALYADSFGNRTPDLVAYWFERARRQLAAGQVRRVGLLATNSIRGGTNRIALERITHTGRIFMAWSEHKWTQNGAAVNVSLIAFDRGDEKIVTLDGRPVGAINADLTSGVDLTAARPLRENRNIVFQGIIRRGPFDISDVTARQMLEADPANRDVVKPIWNGKDITDRPRQQWVIDFGVATPIEHARRYTLPFAYVEEHVRSVRQQAGQTTAREHWWLHWNARPEMRQHLAPLKRYIATPAVSKHRLFAWLDQAIHPDHALIVFARADDYFFGVLHSYVHAIWALRLGTSLEDRPRYTPTTTFETFPFPWPPGCEPVESPAYQAIATAAQQLYQERDTWLRPMEVGATHESPLQVRTLTQLYNALNVFRGTSKAKTTPDAADFAPRLDALHRALDAAVCAAYGWEDLCKALGRGDGYRLAQKGDLPNEPTVHRRPYIYMSEGEEEISRRLLALNLVRV